MESPWQPIQTALKDGSKIAYVDNERALGVCEWDGDGWYDEMADQLCYPVLWVPAPLTTDLHKT